MNNFLTLIARDLKLAVREGGAIGTALGFFLLVVAMMPLGLGPDLKLLTRIAPGILWIALLLAALLSLGRIFESDADDGALDVMATSPMPLELVAAAKAAAHWISTGIPLALLAPVLGILLNLDIAAYPALIATMLAGTPAVSFIGAIGAALTLKARRGGLLLALVVLPLYIPTLIFGISAVSAVTLNMGAQSGAFLSSFLILIAISLASVVLGPLAAAAALRIQMQ
ncbi:MAG: heme exporter protein CcmB [Hyphomicrobium sp.]|nr:heme exporter protein CcmB [Hyphomicrobium sp.]